MLRFVVALLLGCALQHASGAISSNDWLPVSQNAGSTLSANTLAATSLQNVFWAQEQFGAFEMLGRAEVILGRGGETLPALEVVVTLTGSAPRVLSFQPGELQLRVPIVLTNDIYTQGTRTVELLVNTSVTNGVMISRPRASLVILDDETPGTLDPSFPTNISTMTRGFSRQADGKILLGYGSEDAEPKIIRLNPDGSRDNSFPVSKPTEGSGLIGGLINQIDARPDGRIYVGGEAFHFNRYSGLFLVRLNPNGTIDTTFNANLPPPQRDRLRTPTALFAVMPDEKIVIGDWYNPEPLQRLQTNGAIDGTFPNLVGFTRDLIPLEDGGLFVAGDHFNDTDVALLYPDGQRDTNFNLRAEGWVGAIMRVENDLVVAGIFTSINGFPTTNLARVSLSGVVNTAWRFSVEGLAVMDLETDNRGRIYVAGSFNSINGVKGKSLARLLGDGAVDVTFQPAGYFNLRETIVVLEDNSILIDAPDSEPLFNRQGLIRLEGDAPPALQIERGEQGLVISANSSMRLESSSDFSSWIRVKTFSDFDRNYSAEALPGIQFFRLKQAD